MNLRLTYFIVVTLLVWVTAVIGQDDDNRKNGLSFLAGSTEFKNMPDGTIIKTYYNGVKAWTKNRDSDIESDVALFNSLLGETRFYGSASFRDSTRYLNADTLIYYDKSGEIIAIGNVLITEKDRTIRAERVRYEKKLRLVHVTDGVKIRDDSLRVTITGAKAVFNDSTNYGLIIGTPVLVKEDAKGSYITVSCEDTLEIVKEKRVVRLWNNVEFVQDSLKAFSGRAVYDDSSEVVILTDKPQVHHVMYEKNTDALSELRAESYITGDTIKISLRERKVNAVDVSGNATSSTVWTDSTDTVFSRNLLESAKMSLLMDGDYISTITAEGTASSYYFKNPAADEKMFVNEATGDTLRFYYTDGKITHLRISGYGGSGAKGKYYEFSPAEDDSVETGN